MTTEPVHDIRIRGEFTPDPSVCRFVVSKNIFEEDFTFTFNSPDEAPGSELIAALFAVEGVSRVSVLQDTFSVTKKSDEAWPKLAGKIIPIIKRHLSGDSMILDEDEREKRKGAPLSEDDVERIRTLVEESISPALASHGGWVKLVDVRDQDVVVQMGGGCQGCASSQATMKFGIERAIREAVPAVRKVIDETDHSAGENPYYT